MANESKKRFSREEEEKKLAAFYMELMEGKSNQSAEEQKKFLLQLLNTKISELEPKTDRIGRIHYFLGIGVMLLSGFVTVILGLKLSGGNWFSENISNIALVVTAIATFLSSLSVFWNPETYWIRNKIMLNKLKQLRYEYVFYLKGVEKIEPKDLKSFLDKLIANLGDEYWEKFLSGLDKTHSNE